MNASLHDRLKGLRRDLPQLAEVLKLEAGPELTTWCKVVDTRLLTRLDPGFPLVAAICGGGSSGKSTLFNSLAGGAFAPVGGRAGMNRRVLISLPASMADKSGMIAALVEPFAAALEPLRRTEDLLRAGGPLFIKTRPGFLPVVLLDTPDFDTGSRGQYANRQSALGALEAADILIYVFTNSNYNNRDNTDFISRMLTGIGRRKCILVYRCYPSFTPEEVAEHALTVARNIYGGEVERWVLGIFRAEEDNRVAAGEQGIRLRPLRPEGASFEETVRGIDATQLRRDLQASTVSDVLVQAEEFLSRGRNSFEELRRYASGVRAAQNFCLQQALRHFPMDRVMRRFAKIWARTDPPAVKLMRRAGGFVELPLKVLIGTAGWARRKLSAEPPTENPSQQFAQRLEENLVTAATDLHQQVLSPHITHRASVSGLATVVAPGIGPAGRPATASAPAVVMPAQERLRQRDFNAILQAILACRGEIGDIGADMEKDLGQLADHFRSRMGVWDKVGQTFWAFLNVLPAAAAVTYVLSTGDAVGATAIKVKLTGLFGLKDLYALVAIPVTRGLKQADRKQLQAMLGPVAQAWLNSKLQKVQALFEHEITGDILRTAEQAAAESQRLMAAIGEGLARSREGEGG
ncbi:MAG: GTPase domain-containing protein [Hyphomicrobiales bacterium]